MSELAVRTGSDGSSRSREGGSVTGSREIAEGAATERGSNS